MTLYKKKKIEKKITNSEMPKTRKINFLTSGILLCDILNIIEVFVFLLKSDVTTLLYILYLRQKSLQKSTSVYKTFFKI